MGMKTSKAGERKRTVTIVIGPLTETLMENVMYASRKKTPSYEGVLTSYIGMALDAALHRDCQSMHVAMPRDWTTHFD